MFVTPNCEPCQRLKRDVAAGAFKQFKIVFCNCGPQLNAFDLPELEREFREMAKPPKDDLVFPLVRSSADLPHPDHSRPARVWTSASARTVPANCGSDDLTGVAVSLNARGMVSG